MSEDADMQVINLHTAVEQAYRTGFEEGREGTANPIESLSHLKEMQAWLLGTRQDLMAHAGMARDSHTGLHNGHNDVGIICDGYDSRDTPLPIEVTSTRHTYDTVMTAYNRGFLDKCEGKDMNVPHPDEL